MDSTITHCEFLGPGRHEHRTSRDLHRTNMLAGICLQPSAWEPMPGPMNNIRISDLTMREVTTPFHIVTRAGNTAGSLLIERVTATATGGGTIAAGIASGLAVASRINVAPIVGILAVALFVPVFSRWRDPQRKATIESAIGRLVVAAIVTLITVRIFMPYAFDGLLHLDRPTVAGTFRRNRKMTRMTSASVRASVNCTSSTERRIDTDRS